MTAKLKTGDVFEISLDPTTKRYFQYAAKDASQLHSDVIRVFAESYGVDENPDFSRVVQGKTDFHAHVLLSIGVKLGFWRKCGRAPAVDVSEVIFRASNDYGNPKIKISKNWFVWTTSGPHVHVGELTSRYQAAEIGALLTPDDIVERIRNGRYSFFYPGY